MTTTNTKEVQTENPPGEKVSTTLKLSKHLLGKAAYILYGPNAVHVKTSELINDILYVITEVSTAKCPSDSPTFYVEHFDKITKPRHKKALTVKVKQ